MTRLKPMTLTELRRRRRRERLIKAALFVAVTFAALVLATFLGGCASESDPPVVTCFPETCAPGCAEPPLSYEGLTRSVCATDAQGVSICWYTNDPDDALPPSAEVCIVAAGRDGCAGAWEYSEPDCAPKGPNP